MDDLLSDRLRQRYPVDQVIDLIKSHQDELSLDKLIESLESINDINKYYLKLVLKGLIDKNVLQDKDEEGIFSEWIYDKYIELLNVNFDGIKDNDDIIMYRFNSAIKVLIREKPYLISAMNTTGFRTWAASVYLSKYLVDHEDALINDDDNILELGAGTGLVSLTIASMDKMKDNKLRRMYVTDGDSELVSGQMQDNFQMNEVNVDNHIKLQKLWWNSPDQPIPERVNVVIGADVTYDSTCFTDLCSCLRQCLLESECYKCLIASTIRNVKTDKLFQSTVEHFGMRWKIITSTCLLYTSRCV